MVMGVELFTSTVAAGDTTEEDSAISAVAGDASGNKDTSEDTDNGEGSDDVVGSTNDSEDASGIS